MAEYLVLGRVREAEQKILNAVKFSEGLKDTFKVELDPCDITKLVATFHTASGEMISKKVDTSMAANDWLLSLLESMKQGSLTAGLKKMKHDAKPQVEVEKAVDQMMSHGCPSSSSGGPGSGLDLALGSESMPATLPPDAADVTADFLAVASSHNVPLPPSTLCVHKGSLKTFMTMAYSNQEVYGVLFGKKAWNGKFHATQIILTNDSSRTVTKVLENEQLATHCKALGLECCGVLVTGSYDHWSKVENQVAVLEHASSLTNPILIVVHFGEKVAGEAAAWEMNAETGNMTAVTVSYTSQPHDIQKRLQYNICWIEDIGVSHLEHATKKICKAILAQVIQSQEPKKMCRQVPFRKVHVPADGLCGWYALMAAEDVATWERIPRNEGAHPINTQVLQQEVQRAKDLHQGVCEKALQVCDKSYHPAIREVLKHPNFSPADLEWISFTCSICIRCTCDPKAKCCQMYIYIYMYICIYIYIILLIAHPPLCVRRASYQSVYIYK